MQRGFQSWERLLASVSSRGQAKLEANQALQVDFPYPSLAPRSGSYKREAERPQARSWGLELLSQATEVVNEEMMAAAPSASEDTKKALNPLSQNQRQQPTQFKAAEDLHVPSGMDASTAGHTSASLQARPLGKRSASQRDDPVAENGSAGCHVFQPVAKAQKLASPGQESDSSGGGNRVNSAVCRESHTTRPLKVTSKHLVPTREQPDSSCSPRASASKSGQQLQLLSRLEPSGVDNQLLVQHGPSIGRDKTAARFENLQRALQRQLEVNQEQDHERHIDQRQRIGIDAEMSNRKAKQAVAEVLSRFQSALSQQKNQRAPTSIWDQESSNSATLTSLLQQLLQHCQAAGGRPHSLQQVLLADQASKLTQVASAGAEHTEWRSAGGCGTLSNPAGCPGDSIAANLNVPEGCFTQPHQPQHGRDQLWRPAGLEGLRVGESLAQKRALRDDLYHAGVVPGDRGLVNSAQMLSSLGFSQCQAEDEHLKRLNEIATSATAASIIAALEAGYTQQYKAHELMNHLLMCVQRMSSAQHALAMHRLRAHKERVSRREGSTMANAAAAVNAAIAASGWAAVSKTAQAQKTWSPGDLGR